VRRNWDHIFRAVPDITAQIRWIADAQTAWSEWEMRGTLQDGSRHHMRGVIIFGVESGEIAWARFYLEPVEQGGGGVDEAVRRHVAAANPAGGHQPATQRQQ
jgi:SnoaL-like protein